MSAPFRKYSRRAAQASLLLRLLIFVTRPPKTTHRVVFEALTLGPELVRSARARCRKGKKTAAPIRTAEAGRSDWIRTSGHLNPIQVLYQTEPHPVKQQNLLYYILKKKASLFCKNFQKYLIYIEIIISNRIFMYKSSVLFSITC